MGNSFFRCVSVLSETLQLSKGPMNGSVLEDMVAVAFYTVVNLGKDF